MKTNMNPLNTTLLIKYDDKPFVILHGANSIYPTQAILDAYSDKFCIPRQNLTGEWVKQADISFVDDKEMNEYCNKFLNK